MANLDDGIKFNDFNFTKNTQQIGGNDAKTEKVDYSDGLTQAELKRLDKNNDGTVTENEFVEVCLEDEEETSNIKSKSESELKTLFKKYFQAFSESAPASNASSGDTEKEEVEVSVKLKKDSTLPESLTFGPSISITGIKTGNKQGEYFSEMTMDGKTYKKTKSSKNHSGIETYTMEPEPKDGSKIVVEKYADGTQYYRVYNTSKKAISELHLDKDGKEKSIFRYKDGYAYEREYLDGSNRVRRYERDEKHKLTSSKDYKKDSNGKIDENKPLSMQTYEYLDEIGAQWKTRVIYEYDENGNQKVKETHVYDYDQKKDENGELTGEMITTRKVYNGDSTSDDDLILQEILKYLEGLITESESVDKDKKTTKVKYNSNGSTTTTITEGEKVTVIEKDPKGEMTSKSVTENGKTTVTTYENGEEKETSTKDAEEASGSDKSDKPKQEQAITPDDAISALTSKGYEQNEAEKIVSAIFGDKTEGKVPDQQITPDDAIQRLVQGGYEQEKAKEIVEIIFGKKEA